MPQPLCSTCSGPLDEWGDCRICVTAHIQRCFERISVDLADSQQQLLWHASAALVWEFKKAPACLCALSLAGGDEDWVVYVPPSIRDRVDTWGWVYRIASMEPDAYELPNGAIVFIGAHA